MPVYREERDVLEREFMQYAGQLVAEHYRAKPQGRREALADFSMRCFARANIALETWTDRVLETAGEAKFAVFLQAGVEGVQSQGGDAEILKPET